MRVLRPVRSDITLKQSSTQKKERRGGGAKNFYFELFEFIFLAFELFEFSIGNFQKLLLFILKF